MTMEGLNIALQKAGVSRAHQRAIKLAVFDIIAGVRETDEDLDEIWHELGLGPTAEEKQAKKTREVFRKHGLE